MRKDLQLYFLSLSTFFLYKYGLISGGTILLSAFGDKSKNWGILRAMEHHGAMFILAHGQLACRTGNVNGSCVANLNIFTIYQCKDIVWVFNF